MDRNDRPLPGDDELERRLGAYAHLRLRPDADSMARLRASLMARAGQTRRPPVAMPAPRAGRRWRAGFAALAAAAVLLVAVGAAAAASGPGETLYGARLWVEQMTLPTDPDARAQAELARLDRRLDEARVAAANGDAAGAAAALAAYDTIAAEAEHNAADDADRMAHLEAELSKHLAVLIGLLDTAPDQALDAIQNAIDSSGKTLDRLQNGGDNGDPGGSPQPGGPDASPGKPSPKPSKEPDASPGKPSPKPSKEPDASPGKPSASPQPGGPDASPGKPSPKPSGSAKP